MLHDRWSTPGPTTNDQVCIPEGRSLQPKRSSRSHRSQQSLALGDAAVGDRSLILPMQYCTAPLSFVLTDMRGPHARRVICGRATYARAVVTGWWKGSSRHLRAYCQGCWDSSSSQLVCQQPARCRRSSGVGRHLTVTCLYLAQQKVQFAV